MIRNRIVWFLACIATSALGAAAGYVLALAFELERVACALGGAVLYALLPLIVASMATRDK